MLHHDLITGQQHDDRRKDAHAADQTKKLRQSHCGAVGSHIRRNDGDIAHSTGDSTEKGSHPVQPADSMYDTAHHQIEYQHTAEQYHSRLGQLRHVTYIAFFNGGTDKSTGSNLCRHSGGGRHIGQIGADIQNDGSHQRPYHHAAGYFPF